MPGYTSHSNHLCKEPRYTSSLPLQVEQLTRAIAIHDTAACGTQSELQTRLTIPFACQVFGACQNLS